MSSDQSILSPAFPQLPTGSIEKTSAFFKSLGFDEIVRHEGFLMIRRGVAEIHFWLAESEDIAKKFGSASSCYIRVQNIQPLFEEFKKNGVVFRYELTKQPWGMLEMQIDDPYLNAIRFGEEL